MDGEVTVLTAMGKTETLPPLAAMAIFSYLLLISPLKTVPRARCHRLLVVALLL